MRKYSKVFYEEFHKEFTSRALDTIGNRFDQKNRIDNQGVYCQTEMISVTGYIDMLQQIFTLVQKWKRMDKRRKTK